MRHPAISARAEAGVFQSFGAHFCEVKIDPLLPPIPPQSRMRYITQRGNASTILAITLDKLI